MSELSKAKSFRQVNVLLAQLEQIARDNNTALVQEIGWYDPSTLIVGPWSCFILKKYEDIWVRVDLSFKLNEAHLILSPEFVHASKEEALAESVRHVMAPPGISKKRR